MAASTTLTKAQAVSLDILISKAMGALTGLRASARNDFPHALAHTNTQNELTQKTEGESTSATERLHSRMRHFASPLRANSNIQASGQTAPIMGGTQLVLEEPLLRNMSTGDPERGYT